MFTAALLRSQQALIRLYTKITDASVEACTAEAMS